MFDFKNKKTLLITGGVVLVLIIILWMMFSGGGSGTATDNVPLTEVASDPVELIIGREMLAALDKMKATKLDTSFLDNEVYNSLQDFSVEIPKQPIGRRDPFAPL